ncbi:hypothetical protein R5R35_008092 [Gryllus longicercus]|uniref:Alpha-tubulin N-acetyltransferase n=1 Tax=Gryllus longicercus TaxID=2509291 RepID=A0AAN9VG50_9ORTH
MEFPFNVNAIFQTRISIIKRDLLPQGFSGDARAAWKCASQVSDIIDVMGLASARAQGLQKAITTGDRLRSYDHTLYLLVNPEGNGGKGVVVGLLKMGRKKLFVFDVNGQHHEMEPLCVLDFYIHESMQRMGCGKLLYEFMLQEEHIGPEQLAIDRPSEKFLAFLHKHYNLSKIIPQANNYVIFEEFFSNHADVPVLPAVTSTSVQSQWKSQLVSGSYGKTWYGSADDINRFSQSNPSLQRFGARKPSSSIGILLRHSLPDHTNGSIVAAKSAPLSSGDNASIGARSITRESSCAATVIVEPKSVKSLSPVSLTSVGQEHNQSPVKTDLKFRHTPLW